MSISSNASSFVQNSNLRYLNADDQIQAQNNSDRENLDLCVRIHDEKIATKNLQIAIFYNEIMKQINELKEKVKIHIDIDYQKDKEINSLSNQIVRLTKEIKDNNNDYKL